MNENIKVPTHEPIPAWYELGVQDPNTLLILIHQDAMGTIQKYCGAERLISHLASEIGQDFILPTEKRWGFMESFEFVDSGNPDWIQVKAPIPQEDYEGNNQGTHERIMAFRYSLYSLFTTLSLFNGDGETSSERRQLLTIDSMCVEEDTHGGSMNISLTPAMIEFLRKQGENSHLEKVERVMKETSYHIWPRERDSSDKFHALCRQPKWINFTVPGNACGLDPSDYSTSDLEAGYTLSSHNVDSGLQQLTLLMGLAKLHELARQAT